ncbi:MAG TPA: RIO1 family regulatory kinase/ATPase [Anaerolineaceae bacterium]|nr:RIO1 family regulatory kinase/ATPase [Anaerolineaceae bacterium]
MNTHLKPQDLLETENLDLLEPDSRKGKPRKGAPIKRSEHAVMDEIIQHASATGVGDEQAFSPTFTSSRHEREWILNYLGAFYDEQFITDVLARVKGGKEANVYCCQAFPGLGTDLVAAKIYRPRMLRNLRNDALYREGRRVIDESGKQVIDDRALHAVRKGSAYGKELSHTSWVGHEYQVLELLHRAGVHVPRPFASGTNTILMEYLGEAFAPAPTLNRVRLSGRAEARHLYEQLVNDVDTMLACNRIHGDLSAFNVLYWQGEYRIIDFPQSIDPRENRNAFSIFRRDLTRLCEYFDRYAIVSRPASLAWKMWKNHGLADFWTVDDTDWEDREA